MPATKKQLAALAKARAARKSNGSTRSAPSRKAASRSVNIETKRRSLPRFRDLDHKGVKARQKTLGLSPAML